MEKHELDEKIAEVSKTVLSYCMARTSDWHDAEDLAQEILYEITKSAPNIRDDRAITVLCGRQRETFASSCIEKSSE